MAASHENVSMALFCDFENVALGVRDANYEKLDIRLVLEKLLLKGSIVIKKAYCDWDRYKGFKAAMHEANFELIEIPHVRQSGKNSADIRLVVDALDLCYTKSHLDTFVIISGDSDFSPLVSKLRENAKYVIGVGVKQSTSDLLIANCDEFIFYDDLVRETQRTAARRDARDNTAPRRSPEDERRRKEEGDARRSKAVELAIETFDALATERGDSGKIWASALKDAIKRRKPDFNESYYGFRAFGNLLEEARARGLLEIGRDEKSGTFVYRNAGAGDNAQGGEGDSQIGRQDARQDGRQEGRQEVRQDGRQEGRQEGRQDGRQESRGDAPRSSRGRGRGNRDRRPAAQADTMSPQPPSSDTDVVAMLATDAQDAPWPVDAPADTGLMDDPTPAMQNAAASQDTAAAQDATAKPNRKPHPVPARTAKAAAQKAAQEAARANNPSADPFESATSAQDVFVPAPVKRELFTPVARHSDNPFADDAADHAEGGAERATGGRRRGGRQGNARQETGQQEGGVVATDAEHNAAEPAAKSTSRRRTSGRRTPAAQEDGVRGADRAAATADAASDAASDAAPAAKSAATPAAASDAAPAAPARAAKSTGASRRGSSRKVPALSISERVAAASAAAAAAAAKAAPAAPAAPAAADNATDNAADKQADKAATKRAPRKTATRARRPRKDDAAE
ncbi:NYN domain-containing protein [Bordetella sp. N]|uniref:NYN domain-containing protein n=1 Tax=Bordetella sp. N TaxID=1746199 RepID=UPI000A648667